MQLPSWPARQNDEAIEIVAETATSTHTIERTKDNVVCFQIRPDVQLPQIVERTKHLPEYMVLSQTEIDAAYHMLHAS